GSHTAFGQKFHTKFLEAASAHCAEKYPAVQNPKVEEFRKMRSGPCEMAYLAKNNRSHIADARFRILIWRSRSSAGDSPGQCLHRSVWHSHWADAASFRVTSESVGVGSYRVGASGMALIPRSAQE